MTRGCLVNLFYTTTTIMVKKLFMAIVPLHAKATPSGSILSLLTNDIYTVLLVGNVSLPLLCHFKTRGTHVVCILAFTKLNTLLNNNNTIVSRLRRGNPKDKPLPIPL